MCVSENFGVGMVCVHQRTLVLAWCVCITVCIRELWCRHGVCLSENFGVGMVCVCQRTLVSAWCVCIRELCMVSAWHVYIATIESVTVESLTVLV